MRTAAAPTIIVRDDTTSVVEVETVDAKLPQMTAPMAAPPKVTVSCIAIARPARLRGVARWTAIVIVD